MEPIIIIDDSKILEEIEQITKKISELETQRKAFETSNDLLQAGKVSKKCNKLRSLLSSKKKQSTKVRLLKDKRQLDDAHSLSLSLFNQTWAEKKKKILDDLAQEEEKIKGKIKEKAQKKEENKISVPSKPKPDPNYLNLKKTKEALIKQKQYDKAYEVEQKIKKIEKIKQAQWEDLKNEKKIIKTERQVKANEQVLQNFAAKKELALFEFERSKKKEFDHLSKKYKNTATDLALSQKTLKTRLTSTEKVSQKELSQSKPELKPVEITDTSTSIAD